jgi:hypothetical protein
MSYDITVILAKTSWCPHCVNFTPIYESCQEKVKPELFDNCSVHFQSYELDRPLEKNRFTEEHPGLMEHLQGYPTVYLKIMDKNKNSKPKIEIIEHTVAKDRNSLNEARDEFLENIINRYKTIKSGNTVEFKLVHSHNDKQPQRRGQKGGRLQNITTLEETKYRDKYLKYKSKYLKYKSKYL